ncbi:septal ring lytic transglycosylase RlpA family protein [Pseudomonas matsuisoli]|nr:septal ring lytic transglycosylase RlpA family protein [Pseudomonas matsuisoli]
MRTVFFRLVALGAAGLLVASCSSQRSSSLPSTGGVASSGAGDYSRPHKDGAPWWDVDVSKVQDAVPMPHYGAYKANPYTVLGKTYYPIADSRNYRATGTASWYGTKFHGQATANGETYDLYGMTAAHKTLPLPSYVRVTNLDNGRSVMLRVNDRGPFYSDRVIDLSFAAAKKLGYAETGTARVTVEGIDPVEWWAKQGRPVPANDKGLAMAAPAVATNQTVENYTPPPQQHAAPVQPAQVAVQSAAAGAVSGLYVQVGAFANPDAAELLKDKLSQTTQAPVFIDSVIRNQQTLHRVRLGPLPSQDEARQLQDSLRLANLGQPTLVKPD